MNTIMLAHPKAGQHTSVKAIPGSRLSMDFVLEDVTVERHGEDLVFVFDDGSSLLIEDFYVDFTGENLPEFEVGGQIVSGADFLRLWDLTLLRPLVPRPPAAPATAKWAMPIWPRA
ncbi:MULTISPECIES: hypothetical protein [unclassified Desulfovibrio]|uniref:hypothetical protein n=1 Tax=unclassified Desulfovibrio TaxID=2593640 RepID=UPI002FD9F347